MYKEKLSGRGRIIIRPSGTEPVLRIMVEGEDASEITGIADQIAEFIESRQNGFLPTKCAL